jgi:caffeoyl-CoA O-methyltransferase
MTDQQQAILTKITDLFAPEDEGLHDALNAAETGGLPAIQIQPLAGKFLQFLAAACNAHKILELGALSGYSGIWLARALPPGGRLISLEANPRHAQVARRSFERAGVADRAEVREGKALDLLPALTAEAPFDLVFIDADKAPYPQYLDWALRLTRPGSIIVADNCLFGGSFMRHPEPSYVQAIEEYSRRAANDPSLISLALPLSKDYTDGFTISIVRETLS